MLERIAREVARTECLSSSDFGARDERVAARNRRLQRPGWPVLQYGLSRPLFEGGVQAVSASAVAIVHILMRYLPTARGETSRSPLHEKGRKKRRYKLPRETSYSHS